MEQQQPEDLRLYGNQLLQRVGPTGSGIPEVISDLVSKTRIGGYIDPTNQYAIAATWCLVADSLAKAGASFQAIAIYKQGLNHFYNLQRESNTRFHKGTLLHNTGAAYLAAGDRHTALWYYRLAYIEDALNRLVAEDPRPEAPATAMLRFLFGVPDHNLDLWKCEAGCANNLNIHARLDRLKLFYPEITAVELAAKNLLGPVQKESRFDVPLNTVLLEDLESGLDHGNTDDRGKSLEQLTTYLCTTLPGVTIRRRLRTKQDELDLVLIQRDAAPGYLVDALGRTILVECKHWQEPVGALHINHLAAKIRLHGCKTGLLVATNSVSGKRTPGKGLSDGQLILQGWFHQDGLVICTIDRSDIRRMSAGETAFSDLVLAKFDELRFAYSEDA
ncbi:MAG: restriction endonuclease [Acidobacteriota bacterium]